MIKISSAKKKKKWSQLAEKSYGSDTYRTSGCAKDELGKVPFYPYWNIHIILFSPVPLQIIVHVTCIDVHVTDCNLLKYYNNIFAKNCKLNLKWPGLSATFWIYRIICVIRHRLQL